MFDQVFCFPKQIFSSENVLSSPRASKKDFDHFSFVFLEIKSWITELSFNYPTRMVYWTSRVETEEVQWGLLGFSSSLAKGYDLGESG